MYSKEKFMKKIKLSVLALTLIGGLLLTGCKRKDSTDPSSTKESSSGSKTTEVSSSSSGTPVDRHKITEQEYLKIRDFFNSEHLFIDGNLTISHVDVLKINNGKIEYTDEWSHDIYDLAYSEMLGTFYGHEYNYIVDEWHKDSAERELDNLMSIFNFWSLSYMVESLSDLTYSKETHKYTGKNVERDIDNEFVFEDGKLVSYVASWLDDGERVVSAYEMTNYGTTKVVLPFVEPGNSLTPPPSGSTGFPQGIVDAFLEENDITDYVIPTIADDQAWAHKWYSSFPILKLWTLDREYGISFEEDYYGLYEMAGVSISERYYDSIGYTILGSTNKPKVAFEGIDDYFVIYICAPEYAETETEDGCYPRAQLNEYMDLINIKNIPETPILDLKEPGWKYQNFFYTEEQMWRLFTSYPDPNSPDNKDATGVALEDLYKELLESEGWEIDSSLYDVKGYFATKQWVTIQFFSWENLFKVWVYKA